MRAQMTVSKDKITITDPRPGKSPQTFERKDLEGAVAAQEAIDKEIEATSGPRIEIISRDGKPANGVPTVQARTDYTVYKNKKGEAVTEADMCAMTGYVLVSRDGSGHVRSEYAGGTDISKQQVLTLDGINRLKALFGATAGQ